MAWTEEMVEQLSRLWDEGLTTGEIGKRLGVSKNAVVGKAHRLGLKSRPSPIKRDKKKAAKKKAAPKKNQITVLDLTARMCRWPIGDPRDSDFHFCGKEIIMGATYCNKHAKMAYVTPNKDKKRGRR